MNKLNVMTIFGTRPEAIKMAPLVKELKSYENINTKVCVTAQHREMLDQVLHIFNIIPDFDLDIMKDKQTLSHITCKVLQGIEGIIAKERPDIILVHGDTTTTFSASLAAFYNNIKIGHVEAGLRTFNKYFPFPEEINRKLTSNLADIHFAPTINSKNNLLNEGIRNDIIYVTGNTVIDAMKSTVNKDYKFKNKVLNELDFKNKRIIFVTAHRRENLGEPLENICMALQDIAFRYNDVEIVYLVHLNPIVSETAERILGNNKKIHLLPPLDIMETHNLMDRAFLVLTDSGGLQEEAPHLGKPVLVLRDVTERPEAVKAGTLKIIGTNRENIVKEASRLIQNQEDYLRMSKAINPFGDGEASRRIVQAILYYFKLDNKIPDEYGN